MHHAALPSVQALHAPAHQSLRHNYTTMTNWSVCTCIQDTDFAGEACCYKTCTHHQLAWCCILTCDVPPMMSTGTPASSRAWSTPRWASPRDPPPESTSPTALPAIHRPSRAKSYRTTRNNWARARAESGGGVGGVEIWGRGLVSCRSLKTWHARQYIAELAAV